MAGASRDQWSVALIAGTTAGRSAKSFFRRHRISIQTLSPSSTLKYYDSKAAPSRAVSRESV